MYRGSSPIFDVPKFPTLRRVKPLPKRRRTSNSHVLSGVSNMSSLTVPTLPQDATPHEIVAHAEALSAQMALQSYYMPILGGVQDLLRNASNEGGIDFSMMGEGRNSRDEEEDHGDGDYIDHLQQPGNTKKRKVPANVSGSPHGGHDADGNSGGEDESTERIVPTRFDSDGIEVVASPPAPKPEKMSKATKVGLQHKEMLKNRKKRLAAVLGALSHGDTLALDQALSSTYPSSISFLNGDLKRELPKVRLSRRHAPRLTRARKALDKTLPSPSDLPNAIPFPKCEFTFSCHSASEYNIALSSWLGLMIRASS
jgi:hypothetical protein